MWRGLRKQGLNDLDPKSMPSTRKDIDTNAYIYIYIHTYIGTYKYVLQIKHYLDNRLFGYFYRLRAIVVHTFGGPGSHEILLIMDILPTCIYQNFRTYGSIVQHGVVRDVGHQEYVRIIGGEADLLGVNTDDMFALVD